MPVDQKRVNGPESSVPYNIYIHSEVKNKEIQPDAPKRHDGRSNNELRNICKVMIEIIIKTYQSLIFLHLKRFKRKIFVDSFKNRYN